MTAVCHGPVALAQDRPPIEFFYSHLHDSIRGELQTLSNVALHLEGCENLRERLSHLRERYRFLGQVYKYHSSVEDEVVYPALDSKVKNVTLAYSVEHEDEEQLFVQLGQLLSQALQQTGKQQASTVRQLACKVEEIHTTLRKHLAKEEEQLLPLLLRHFSYGEQAELVAQFLCCIPLATVQQVLSWLKSTMPQQQQAGLQWHVGQVVSDRLLQQLLVAWLRPGSGTTLAGAGAFEPVSVAAEPDLAASAAGEAGARTEAAEAAADGRVDLEMWDGGAEAAVGEVGALSELPSMAAAAAAGPPFGAATMCSSSSTSCGANGGSTCERFVCCREAAGGEAHGAASPGGLCRLQRDMEESASTSRPPLREIVYFHHAIRSALASFAEETRALQALEGGVTAAQLQALVERHRFIRAVCLFHSASEDEVVFPALRKVTASQAQRAQQQGAAGVPADRTAEWEQEHAARVETRHRCEADHAEESSKFEELGRLLGDVKACARRGAKDVAALVRDIARCAEGLARAITRHMAREESEVLPLLSHALCYPEQRNMIWRLLRAMPLRLLERVMPWVAGKMREEDVSEWLRNLAVASPQEDAPLVQLIIQWALRGRELLRRQAAAAGEGQGAAAGRRGSDDPSLFSNQTCGPASFLTSALSVASSQAAVAAAAAAAAGAAVPRNHAPLLDGVVAARTGAPASAGAEAAAVAPAAATAVAAAEGDVSVAAPQPPLKRIRTEPPSPPGGRQQRLAPGVGAGVGNEAAAGMEQQQAGAGARATAREAAAFAAAAAAAAAETPRAGLPLSPRSTLGTTGPGGYNPIDHIFQFHKALKRELKELESAAAAFQAAVDTADCAVIPQAIQDLAARFSFLRGIYRAHSKAEDEIVFPALECKEALHNVSHAYSLDHQKEEALFEDLGAVMEAVRHLADPGELVPYASQLSRMCAAVRASLETHVRAEERQLWPLFAEHFSAEEQEALIGQIIGQTGAEVLHSMLSWVRGAMSHEEQEAMLDTMKAASRSTAFEQWLDVAMGHGGGPGAAAGTGAGEPVAGVPAAGAAAAGNPGGGSEGSGRSEGQQGQVAAAPTHQEEMAATLAEVAQYLAKQGGAGGAPAPAADPASIAADSSRFRPGWEDIFRMNQKQLEAAVRRVSTDPSLEPQRKAYLIQNIMASRYIVAQQRRMSSAAGSADATPTAAAAALPPRVPSGAAAAAAAQPREESGLPQAAGLPQASGAVVAAAGPPVFRSFHDAAGGVLGCKHYKRRCQLVAPCCNRIFVCRLCHDEASDHAVDRYAVSEMVCMQCGTRQAVAGSCASCGAGMARYVCNICHLFDDEPGRDIYHCPFCNFCRQGKGLGIDSFHCMSCNACMSLELFRKHHCKEQSLKGNCPVCSDLLFESKYPVKELPCGHFMHSHCFAAYTRYSYTCPICFKSLGDMSVYWQMIDSLVASERLPPQYAAQRQSILCNDCGATCEAPFHFVYHKCARCASYNTRVL